MRTDNDIFLRKDAILHELKRYDVPTDVVITGNYHTEDDSDAMFYDDYCNYEIYKNNSFINTVEHYGHVVIRSLPEFTAKVTKDILDGAITEGLSEIVDWTMNVIIIPKFVGTISAGIRNTKTGNTFKADFSKFALWENYEEDYEEDYVNDYNTVFINIEGTGDVHIIDEVDSYKLLTEQLLNE